MGGQQVTWQPVVMCGRRSWLLSITENPWVSHLTFLRPSTLTPGWRLLTFSQLRLWRMFADGRCSQTLSGVGVSLLSEFLFHRCESLVFDIYYRTWGHTFCQRNVSVKNNQLWIMQNHPFYHLKYMLLHWFSSPLLWTMLYEKYITSIICSIVQYWQRYALDWVPF